MILLILIQITVSDVLSAYNAGEFGTAYQLSVQVPDTVGFYQDEIIELRAMTAMGAEKFEVADSLFRIAIHSEYDSIRRKALTNYAELKHRTFNFDRRIELLKKAYAIEPTDQLKRIIARHHFQINADYESAEKWISKHPDIDHPGYKLLLAEYTESQRQFEKSLELYMQAKKLSNEAGLFNYELFASKGSYRVERLIELNKHDNFKFWLEKVILCLVVYGIVKYNLYRHDRANNVAS